MKTIKSQLLLITLIITLSFTGNAFADGSADSTKEPKKESYQYWAETGFSLLDYERTIVPRCYQSLSHLQGCIDSINHLLGMAEPHVAIATESEAAAIPELYGNKVRDLGNQIGIYEIKALKEIESEYQYATFMRKVRAAHRDAVQMMWAATMISPLPFNSLLSEYKTLFLKSKEAKKEAQLTASMFNSFLQIITDPHTYLVAANEHKAAMENADNSFVGIGCILKKVGTQVMIQDFIQGGPAEKSGLHAGDIFTEVNGVTVVGLDLPAVREKIIGPENTEVKVKVKRKDKELEFVMNRSKVVDQNVSYKMVQDAGVAYGYIKLKTFMDQNASETIKSAIVSLTKQGAQGLILDLRGNGGGLLQLAAVLGNYFLGKKDIVITKDLSGVVDSQMSFTGTRDAITHLPMVTLIDGGSASASEILAGALQDHQRSWIVGDRSFGKGSVQSSRNYNRDGSIAMMQTIRRFYQPSGRTNQIQGIIPNFYVDPSPNATEEEKFSMREEDFYSNALPAIGNKWSEPCPETIVKINQCRTKNGMADRVYSTQKAGDFVSPPDYRLLVAQEILFCGSKELVVH